MISNDCACIFLDTSRFLICSGFSRFHFGLGRRSHNSSRPQPFFGGTPTFCYRGEHCLGYRNLKRLCLNVRERQDHESANRNVSGNRYNDRGSNRSNSHTLPREGKSREYHLPYFRSCPAYFYSTIAHPSWG